MKTSKFNFAMCALACIIIVAIIYGVVKGEASPTPQATTISITPTPTTTIELEGHYLIEDETPKWLITETEGNNASEYDDYKCPQVRLAMAITNHIDKYPSTESFKIDKIVSGIRCSFIEYQRLDTLRVGDIILDFNEETSHIDGLDKKTDSINNFSTVKKIIERCWEQDHFWTQGHNNYVHVGGIKDSDSHTQTAIFFNGRFLTLLPESFDSVPPSMSYQYDSYPQKTWCDDTGTIYRIDSNSILSTWKWKENAPGDWQSDGTAPFFAEKDVTKIVGGSVQYLITEGNKVEVWEPYLDQNTFGLKRRMSIEFKGATIIRPFQDYEGAETADVGIVAVPEKGELWRISLDGSIAKGEIDQLEVIANEVWARKDDEVEIIAKLSSPSTFWEAPWRGEFVRIVEKVKFNDVIKWRNEKEFKVSGNLKSNEGRIVLEREDILIAFK